MKNKKLWLVVGIVLLLAAVASIVLLRSGSNAEAYNTSVTKRAQASLQISNQDIMILKSITKDPGGDSKAEFYIYRLPDGAKAEDYLHLQVSKVKEDSGLVHMGSATCTFIGDDPSAIYNLSVLFLR